MRELTVRRDVRKPAWRAETGDLARQHCAAPQGYAGVVLSEAWCLCPSPGPNISNALLIVNTNRNLPESIAICVKWITLHALGVWSCPGIHRRMRHDGCARKGFWSASFPISRLPAGVTSSCPSSPVGPPAWRARRRSRLPDLLRLEQLYNAHGRPPAVYVSRKREHELWLRITLGTTLTPASLCRSIR